MTTTVTYWLFQVAGWGAYSIIGVLIGSHYDGWHTATAIGFALYFVYTVGLTEGLRQVIKHGRWHDLPMPPRLARLAAGVGIIATIQVVLVTSISLLLEPGRTTWDTQGILGLAWGTTVATATWTALYMGLTTSRRRQERDVAAQLALREAELRALRQQVNPHFLFNCLNSIRALVLENPARAQDMITRLASLLRYGLQHGARDTVPLDTELKVVADYLALESVRFDARLRVRIDVDPAVVNVEVPTMLLSTLVENAVTHGIAQLPEGGEIAIRAAADRGHAVRIEVMNTGQLSKPRHDSTGLANIRERLQLLYANRAHLALSSDTPDRVMATVTIPTRP
jgi:two-component system LytT family sensor kinase